ncbi:hypothetical protein EPO15_07745 [bacterium]|nr:MAG: hypothetical protein EPO15_07745 [bacterium]
MSFDHPHLHPGPPGGRTLRVRVAADGPLSETAALRMGRELAEALSWLHAAGRRHGRLTPDSVFFDAQGRAVLALEAPEPDADKGWVPFEQGAGKAAPASDLYQLGATLLFAASGREPVSVGLPLAYRTPPELAAYTASGRELVEWLVEPRWDRRPADAALVAADTLAASQGRPNSRRVRRTRSRALVAGGLAVALGGLGLGLFGGLRTPPPPAAPPTAPSFPDSPRRIAAPAPRVALEWSRVTGPHPDVMRVSRDENGDVVVFTKYEVTRFKAGIPGAGEKGLGDIIQVSKNLAGPSAGDGTARLSFAVGTVGWGGRVWTGGWDGGAQGHAFATGKFLAVPALGDSGRVDDMAVREGVLYAAHRGALRAWREGEPDWKPTGLPPGVGASAVFVARDGTLYAGGTRGVWREKDGSWIQLWTGGGQNDEVRFLGEDALGLVLVGTRDGLVTLRPNGDLLGRDLRGKVVTSAADAPDGRLWVGTWDGGLHMRHAGKWFPFGYAQGLPDDTVSGVALDREGLLWVGLYGHGAYVRGEAEAAAAARAARPSSRLNGTAYSSVADAARRNLTEGRANGGVARLELEGLDYVYFGGRQVAPPGVGALGVDGTSARHQNGLWLLRAAGGSDAALPPMPGGSGPTAALLDSRGRLWVGTDRSGVHVYSDGAWTTHGAESGLDDNPVTALTEDKSGRVWAATSPFFDAKAGRYARMNLHRFDGSGWRHWSPAEGLGYWSSRDVRALPDGSVAVATNGGISIVDGDALRSVPGPEDGGLRGTSLVPLQGGALLCVHPDAGVSWSDKDGGRRVTSRNGLFADSLDAAAADGGGNVWLVAADGRAFIAPASALREAR